MAWFSGSSVDHKQNGPLKASDRAEFSPVVQWITQIRKRRCGHSEFFTSTPTKDLIPENIKASIKTETMNLHFKIENPSYLEIHKAFGMFVQAKGYKPKTVYSMKLCNAEFLSFLEGKSIDRITAVTPEHIIAYHSYITTRKHLTKNKGLSSSQINHHIYALRTFFGWLQRMGAMEFNPTTGLDFEKQRSQKRIALSTEQITKLFDAADGFEGKALLAVFYGCGLRRSEVVDLHRADVYLREAKLIVRSGKFGKRREVPLSQGTLTHIENYIRYERPKYLTGKTGVIKELFVNSKGNPMLGAMMNDRIKAIARKAGIEPTPTLHHLRHAIATHLKLAGMSMEQIKEFLGHSSLDVTQGYIEGFKSGQWKKKNWHNKNPFKSDWK